MGIITALKCSAYARGTIECPAKCHFYCFRLFLCVQLHLYSGTMLLRWFTFICVEYVLEVQFYNQYLSFMVLCLKLLAMFGMLFGLYLVWEFITALKCSAYTRGTIECPAKMVFTSLGNFICACASI